MEAESFIQNIDIDGARVYLYAANSPTDGEPYWRLFIEQGSVQTTIQNFNNPNALEDLKNMKKLLNDAIKHLNDKKGKTNDEHTK